MILFLTERDQSQQYDSSDLDISEVFLAIIDQMDSLIELIDSVDGNSGSFAAAIVLDSDVIIVSR